MHIFYNLITSFIFFQLIIIGETNASKPQSIAPASDFKTLEELQIKIDSLLENFGGDKAGSLMIKYEQALSRVEKNADMKADARLLYKYKALYLRAVTRLNMAFEKGPAFDSAEARLDQAYSYALLSGDYQTKGKILHTKASMYLIEQPQKGIKCAKELLKIGEENQDDTLRADAYLRLGELFMNQQSEIIKFNYLMKAVDINESIGRYTIAARALQQLTIFSQQLTRKQKAEFFQKSTRLYRKAGKQDNMAYSMEILARFYIESFDNDTIRMALNLCDSAMLIWSKYDNHVPKINNLEIKADCFKKLALFDSLYNQRLSQLSLAKKASDSMYVFSTLLLIADQNYESLKEGNISNYDSAIYYYNQAYNFLPVIWPRYPVKFNSANLSMYNFQNFSTDTNLTKNFNTVVYKYYVAEQRMRCKIAANKPIKGNDIEQLIALSDSANSAYHERPLQNGYPLRTLERNAVTIAEQDNVIEDERNRRQLLLVFVISLALLLIILIYVINKIFRVNAKLKLSIEENIRAQSIIRDRERKLHEEQLAKLVAEQEMKVLRAQMNPHFIFNALNSIHNCILNKDTATASKNLTKFSRLIRKILDNSRKSLCSLNEEITTLKLYVELEKMRFEDDFAFEVNVDLELNPEEIFLPPLLIQPFVENSIWHGLRTLSRPGTITLDIISEADYMIISVEDNGVGRSKSKSENSHKDHESVGVALTTDRLRYFNVGLEVDSPLRIIDLFDNFGQPAGTRVEIVLKKSSPYLFNEKD